MGNLLSSTADDNNNSTWSFNSGSSIQSRTLNQAQSLRQEAQQLRFEAKRASEQSQYEYHYGNKSQAKTLSIKKSDLYREMDEKNCQAAELFFKHYNQNHSIDVIDLHGLYVKEALKYVEIKLDECRSENILQLTIVTGIGNNSSDKIAKIKPQVEKYARQNDLEITSYAGHIVVDLAPRNQYKTTSYQNTNQCIIL